ncbi:hypothetical protein ACFL2D_01595 [Patescibacteria group bacterium]
MQKPREEMMKGMQQWMEWFKENDDSVVDMGSPIMNGKMVTKSDHGESDNLYMSQSVFQAEDLESARKVVETHPHLDWDENAKIEIFEMGPTEM